MGDREREMIVAGEAWAERQHAAGAPSTWVATWQEAVDLGLAPRQRGHQLASLVAVCARRRWRELRSDARPNPGNRTPKRGKGPPRLFETFKQIQCTRAQAAAWEASAAADETPFAGWARTVLDAASAPHGKGK